MSEIEYAFYFANRIVKTNSLDYSPTALSLWCKSFLNAYSPHLPWVDAMNKLSPLMAEVLDEE